MAQGAEAAQQVNFKPNPAPWSRLGAMICYGLGRSGRGGLNVRSQYLARFAVVGALIVAIGLTACGRKGPLDPPPGAAAQPTVQAPLAPPGPGGIPASIPTQRLPGGSNVVAAPPPTGQQRDFPLDFLID